MASGDQGFWNRKRTSLRYLDTQPAPLRNLDEQHDPMPTFYKFGQLWEIPPAAARLGKSLPANTQAFETFLTNLEPMYSAFICAHPRCPKDPDLLRHQAVHGGASPVKLLQRTMGGVLRPRAESHVCFMVPGHRRLFPRQIGFHELGPAPRRNKVSGLQLRAAQRAS